MPLTSLASLDIHLTLPSPLQPPPTPKKFWICEYIVKYVKSTHTFNKQITRLREVSFCLPYPEKNFTNI